MTKPTSDIQEGRVDVGRDTEGTYTKVHNELAEYNERAQSTIIRHGVKTCVSIFEVQ
jgi:hypothetical protein